MSELRYKVAYKKVSEYLAAHPQMTIAEACEKLGIARSQYFYGARKAKQAAPKETKAPKKYRKLTDKSASQPAAPAGFKPPQDAGKLYLLVGTPEQIKELIG